MYLPVYYTLKVTLRRVCIAEKMQHSVQGKKQYFVGDIMARRLRLPNGLRNGNVDFACQRGRLVRLVLID